MILHGINGKIMMSELMNSCSGVNMIGSEPMITVNTGNGTPAGGSSIGLSI